VASQTTQTQVEVETKLDADPAFVVPDLSSLPGVAAVEPAETESLEAFYLDTEDLRLLRGGTTLRRRTGGSDAGWHLKLPAGDGARLEVRRAPGRSVRAVPPALLGLVRVRLRGAPVGPVARIATTRGVLRLLDADGAVLALVADDAVTGEALAGEAGGEVSITSWREIEVELVDGDRELLRAAVDALVAAGARPATASSKVQRTLGDRLAAAAGPAAAEPVNEPANGRRGGRGKGNGVTTVGDVAVKHLREQVAALIAQDPQVRLNTDDSVHQMRVATRRLRSALATFRPIFTAGAVEPLRAELKWLGEVLGKARDAEVMRDRLRADITGQPAELVVGPVLRRVDMELRQTYREAHKEVVVALDGDRYLALVHDLEAFVADPPFDERAHRAAPDEARVLVRRSYRRVIRAVDAVEAVQGEAVDHDHPLHEVRKAAKRARYAAESVRPVVGKKAKKLAKVLEDVQERLGDHQDSVVQRAVLRDLGMRAYLNGENGFTFGRLHALAEARARHDEEEFVRLWEATQRTAKRWPGV
jgi:CHAD domain-containing protein